MDENGRTDWASVLGALWFDICTDDLNEDTHTRKLGEFRNDWQSNKKLLGGAGENVKSQ